MINKLFACLFVCLSIAGTGLLKSLDYKRYLFFFVYTILFFLERFSSEITAIPCYLLESDF